MNYKKSIEEFVMITSADEGTAERILQKAKWNLEVAMEMFFSQGEQPVQQHHQPQSKPQLQKQPSGFNQTSVLISETTLKNGCKLQVRHGDMTEESTDTIVNAANGRLDHASGLAGAISKKGL